MNKRKMKDITLLGIDCIDLDRLNLAMEICQKDFEFADVKILSSLKSDKIKNIINIRAINSLEEYSLFAIRDLDKYVNTPYVLIVQHDGFILNPSAWTDEFLKYDYIGSPWLVADWSVKNFGFPRELVGKYVVGNGGFNLRSKKLLSLSSELYKKGELNKYSPEDVSICVYYRDLFECHGMKFAPVELAKQFSYEAEDDKNYFWDGQFGFHGLKWTDISKWLKANPGHNINNTIIKD